MGTEGQVRWEGSRFELLAGVEGRLHATQAMRSGYRGQPAELDLERTRGSGAGYAQGELRVTRWLQLTVGGRYDLHPDFGASASPRVAAVLQPSSTTTVKLLHGRAFRPPNLYERFYYAPDPGRPFRLRPETIETSEVVVEQAAWRGARWAASAYAWSLRDTITAAPADGVDLAYGNGGRLTARGVELELEQRLARGSVARASWALQRAEDASGGALTNSPRHLGKLQVAGPVWRPVHAGLELLYTSARATLAGGSDGAHVVANATAALRGLAAGRLDVRATLRNALGTRYGDPGSVEHAQDVLRRDGRSFDLELAARF